MSTADLVLEGGGVKGIGLVGAISVLEEHGYAFHRVAGTSAGAIVGALVAAGHAGRRRCVELMRTHRLRRSSRTVTCSTSSASPARVCRSSSRRASTRGSTSRSWLGAELAKLGVRTFADLALDDPGADPG